MTGRVGREEACRVLNTTPRALRALWSTYGSQLGAPSLPRSLDARQVRLLQRAQAMVLGGRASDEVAAALALDEVDEELPGVGELEAKLDEIASTIHHSEAQRMADHDRVLTALMRTQQELNRLRYEVAAAAPRKERRRPAWRFWERRPSA